jgi:cob(I)alamin adenosyltransferase
MAILSFARLKQMLQLARRKPGGEFAPTWRGDTGFTDLLDRQHVPKYDLRVEALGTLDEVSSAIGVARVKASTPAAGDLLLEIQYDLCYMMSEVAGYQTNGTGKQVDARRTAWLEAQLESLQNEAPWAKGFVAPGDTPFSADLHMARAISRRAERQIAKLTHVNELKNPHILAYLNRMAYVLFALARAEEARAGVNAPTMVKK